MYSYPERIMEFHTSFITYILIQISLTFLYDVNFNIQRSKNSEDLHEYMNFREIEGEQCTLIQQQLHLPKRGPVTRCHTILNMLTNPLTGSSMSMPIISMMIIVFNVKVIPKPSIHRDRLAIFQHKLPSVVNAVQEDINY